MRRRTEVGSTFTTRSRVKVTNLRMGLVDLADQPVVHRARRRSCSRASMALGRSHRPAPRSRAGRPESMSREDRRVSRAGVATTPGGRDGDVAGDAAGGAVALRGAAETTMVRLGGASPTVSGMAESEGSVCAHIPSRVVGRRVYSSPASRILRDSISCPCVSACSRSINCGRRPLAEMSVESSLRTVSGSLTAVRSLVVKGPMATGVESAEDEHMGTSPVGAAIWVNGS